MDTNSAKISFKYSIKCDYDIEKEDQDSTFSAESNDDEKRCLSEQPLNSSSTCQCDKSTSVSACSKEERKSSVLNSKRCSKDQISCASDQSMEWGEINYTKETESNCRECPEDEISDSTDSGMECVVKYSIERTISCDQGIESRGQSESCSAHSVKSKKEPSVNVDKACQCSQSAVDCSLHSTELLIIELLNICEHEIKALASECGNVEKRQTDSPSKDSCKKRVKPTASSCDKCNKSPKKCPKDQNLDCLESKKPLSTESDICCKSQKPLSTGQTNCSEQSKKQSKCDRCRKCKMEFPDDKCKPKKYDKCSECQKETRTDQNVSCSIKVECKGCSKCQKTSPPSDEKSECSGKTKEQPQPVNKCDGCNKFQKKTASDVDSSAELAKKTSKCDRCRKCKMEFPDDECKPNKYDKCSECETEIPKDPNMSCLIKVECKGCSKCQKTSPPSDEKSECSGKTKEQPQPINKCDGCSKFQKKTASDFDSLAKLAKKTSKCDRCRKCKMEFPDDECKPNKHDKCSECETEIPTDPNMSCSIKVEYKGCSKCQKTSPPSDEKSECSGKTKEQPQPINKCDGCSKCRKKTASDGNNECLGKIKEQPQPCEDSQKAPAPTQKRECLGQEQIPRFEITCPPKETCQLGTARPSSNPENRHRPSCPQNKLAKDKLFPVTVILCTDPTSAKDDKQADDVNCNNEGPSGNEEQLTVECTFEQRISDR
ncbi:hypothetical protein M8J76_001028 [Diaphorina citri]|nr:hypothetical protein M8J75_006189 [Diaphorina citri]KAI5740158.1 hypothetical protein M8J76_001028 [Diaphorina citri]